MRKKWITIPILAILFILLCVCAWQIYLKLKEYKEIDDLNDDFLSATLTEVDGEEEERFVFDFDAAYAINSDLLGLLYVPAIDMQCLVVQTTNNSYYLTHAFDKSYSSAGCPFVDYRCEAGLESPNVIIYGHNMNNLSMFGKNKRLLSSVLYFQDGNNVFYVYGDGFVRTYLIYMVGNVKAENDNFQVYFDTTEELVEFAQTIQKNSAYSTGVDVSDAAQIVTLSTCTSYGAKYEYRLFIQGMLIEEKNTETGETTTNFDNWKF